MLVVMETTLPASSMTLKWVVDLPPGWSPGAGHNGTDTIPGLALPMLRVGEICFARRVR